MIDREKLVRLIDEVAEGMIIQRCGELVCTVNSDEIADRLLAHGVYVRESQKPLTFDALMERPDGVWYENCIVVEPMMISHEKDFSLVYNENVVIGMLRGRVLNYFKQLELPIADYGKTWRCWTEKPTKEERKNAKWEE